jgi:hypothetical protein
VVFEWQLPVALIIIIMAVMTQVMHAQKIKKAYLLVALLMILEVLQ